MEPKKDGTYRICGDYRRLNAVTVPDRYPIPLLQDLSVNLHEKAVFSKLDLYKAYCQIPLSSEDIPKSAVTTPFGLFEYTVVTFGLRNASQTFQRYINPALSDLDFVFAYIDDILVASSNQEEHEKHLRIVFDRLKQFSLRLNLAKCEFGKEQITFLGYEISGQGSRPSQERVQVIVQYCETKNCREITSIFSIRKFLRICLLNAARTQAPLNVYLEGSVKKDKREIVWSPEAEEAFLKTKSDLANATLLSHQCIDAQTRVVSDASDNHMGASLEQHLDRSWKPLTFFSRKFNNAQTRYSAYDRELTAGHEAVKFFKHFLEGREFNIVTDHKPLIYAFQQRLDKASPRQRRQLSFISQFTTGIQYIPGKDNVVADALLRIDTIRLPLEFDLLELSQEQQIDSELKQIRESPDCSLNLKCIEWGENHHRVYCDLTGSALRRTFPLHSVNAYSTFFTNLLIAAPR